MIENEKFHDAYNATDMAITDVQGLAYALAAVVGIHPDLNAGGAGNAAIHVLLERLQNALGGVAKSHGAEWVALRDAGGNHETK